MSVEISSDIPGMAEADKQLDQMIAADAAAADAAKAKAGESATPEATRAGQKEEQIESTQTQPLSEKNDTPADADPNKDKKDDKAKAGEQNADGKQETRYEKARNRQERSWQELNAQKEALRTEQETLRREREEFDNRRKQAEEQFSPEAYEKVAARFEKEGKFDFAEAAREKAKDLRANPPAQREAKAKEAVETQRKEWTLKAGIDFPDVAKNNSALQLRVAQLMKEEPDLKAHPKGIYMAARLASLETAAASVSHKDKELGQLRAKVKELEALTTPGGPGSATELPNEKPFEQKSDSEQFADLERQAKEIGPLQ